MQRVLAHLQRQLLELPRPTEYRVAYSGGVDSHVLLHGLCRLRAQLPAPLVAVHVHHGLHDQADVWTEHCREICSELHVHLTVVRVDARPARGQSPEAAARVARYRALEAGLAPGGALVTAHHADDQAETVLLQLLRGSGPEGIAGMPAAARRGSGWHLRPLLGLTRGELLAYARAAGLRWVEDSSNADPRVARSYVRREVMPLLRARWPAVGRTVSRAAENAAEAASLAAALAELDLAGCAGETAACLRVEPLTALDPARRRNVLRFWLRRLGLPPPQRVHVRRIEQEALSARRDARPWVHWPGAEVRRYRDRLYAGAPLPDHDPARRVSWDGHRPVALEALGATLSPRAVTGRGVRRAALQTAARLVIGFRRGGERLRPVGRTGHRPLKNLFQECGVPPWWRDRIPLLYVDGALAAVAGLWVAEEFAPGPEEAGVELALEPMPHWLEGASVR